MPSYRFNKPYYNVAPEANDVTLEEAHNVYFEAMPSGGFAIRRRPGTILLSAQEGRLGQGLHWSDSSESLFVISAGKVVKYKDYNAAGENIGEVSGKTLPVVFAGGQKVNADLITYIASGGKLNYIDFLTNTIGTPTDVDTPFSSSIACMNNRFYANMLNHNQDFVITDYNPDPAVKVLDPLYWSSTSNPFRTAQKPDPLVGIYTGWNEMYLWGSQACEVWQEDGITPISPLVGSIVEAGLAAPYSVVMANNTLFALSTIAGKTAVISIQGRSPQVLSEAIAKQLQAITPVYDAIGSLCFVGGLNLYVLTFPTANQTWVYDFKSDVWSQWSQWDIDLALHNRFAGIFGTFAKGWNKHVILSSPGDLLEYQETYSQIMALLSSPQFAQVGLTMALGTESAAINLL